MTEREKQLLGIAYNGADPELVALQYKATQLTDKFNRLLEPDESVRQEILGELFGRASSNLRVYPPLRVDFGCNIYIGDNVFINQNCTFLDNNTITLGNRVMMGPDVKIYAGDHPLEGAKRYYDVEEGKAYIVSYSKAIKIGDDVWIGGGAIILPGVRIGNNVVIGAGSVVNKDIPDNSVAVGNPCKVIKKLKGNKVNE